MPNNKRMVNPRKTDTLVGANTEFHGKLISNASIRIEGKAVGDIECRGDVTIGEKGWAVSNISARNIIICGKVEGEVQAANKITITASGRLVGNHISATIRVEKGGVIIGSGVVLGKEARQGLKVRLDH